MQAKLAQLASQATSTSGTDDVDLMSWYSGNRLWQFKYQPSELVRNKLYRLFNDTGYAHDTFAVPNVGSRIWFNYLQCTPEIKISNASKYRDEWVADLKSKYEQGVFVYHSNRIDGNDVYDFDRQYENWETWIVEGA